VVWLGVPLGIFILALALLSTPYVAGDASHGTGMAGPAGLSDMPYWHPNETKTFELYVENVGDLTDSYMLNVSVDDPRWSGWLDRYMLPDVPPGERDTFNLSIKAPADAREGDKAYITLLARSVRSNKTDHMEWVGFVIVERDVYLKADSSQASVRSGELHEYIVEVVNSGDLDDEYDFHACLTTERGGWEYGVNTTSLALAKGRSASVHVWMRAPAMGVEPATLDVKVQSRYENAVCTYVRLTCNVERSWAASLEPTDREVQLGSGTEMTVELVLHQCSNDLRTSTWDIKMWGTLNAWDVALPIKSFDANGTGDYIVPLCVTSPWNAIPGKRIDLCVILMHPDVPATRLESNLSFLVVATHRLNLSGPQGVLEVVPTVPAIVELNVRNDGNVAEVIEVALGRPLSWSMRAYMNGKSGPNFLLPPWADGIVQLAFDVPADSLSGLVSIPVKVTNTLDYFTVLNLSAMVGVRPAIEVIVHGPVPVMVSPGNDSIGLCVTARNTGNILLGVRIVCNPPVPWITIMYNLTTVALSPGEETLSLLSLSVGRDAIFGMCTLTVEAWEEGAGSMGAVDVGVLVVGPDLNIVSVQIDGMPIVGEEVPLNVTIANDGRHGSEPTKLVILDHGRMMVGAPLAVPAIPPGGITSIHLTFAPSGRWNEYLLEVDPDAVLAQEGDANDTYMMRFKAYSVKQAEDAPSVGGATGIIVLGTALVVGLLLGRRYLHKWRWAMERP